MGKHEADEDSCNTKALNWLGDNQAAYLKLFLPLFGCVTRGRWPTFSFFERWDSTRLSRVGFMNSSHVSWSFISVGTGEDENEPGAARVLSSPPLQKQIRKGGPPARDLSWTQSLSG